VDKETKDALKGLARKDNPIRMSALPMLLTCNGFHVLRLLEEDTAGVAAINGTAIGRACELFHNGEEGCVTKSLEENPGAEEDLIASLFNEYVQDPRNGEMAYLQVLPKYQEVEVNARLRGTTGYHYFKGHIDQLRRDERGRLWVFDLKNTKMYGGAQCVNVYAAQQVMYAIGMSELLGEPVGYGGIIRTRGYIGRTNLKLPVDERPVFFDAYWDLEKCQAFAKKQIVPTLDRLRRGTVAIAPGTQCSYCPAGGAFNCVGAF
jgi:hypothetical protein